MTNTELKLYDIALRGIGYKFESLKEVDAIIKAIHLIDNNKQATIKDVSDILAKKQKGTSK
jgi:hypothetical protein